MDESILFEKDAPVARLTLNRPKVRNAIDGDMIEAMIRVLEECEADDSVRVIVLGAAGTTFCAGGDLGWMRKLAASGAAARGEDVRILANLLRRLDRSPKPVIARVQGPVRGGGNGLVACCDIVVALDSVSFAFPEVRLGLAPAVISPFVVAKIGVPAAREIFVTGRRFDAARGERLGLVSRVVGDEAALDEAVDAYVWDIVRGGPEAVAACKALALDIAAMAPDEATDHTASLLGRLRRSAEGMEGVGAFLQKRPPAWVLAARRPVRGLALPASGKVTALEVQLGDRVEPGTPLLRALAGAVELVLEAPVGGTVLRIGAEVGEAVEAGARLVDIESDLA